MAKGSQGDRDEGLGRTLLGSLLVLLVAALLLRYHMVPAKRRLWNVRRQFEGMRAEALALERHNRELRAERDAILRDPMYQERLMRRMFRIGSTPGDVYLRERP